MVTVLPPAALDAASAFSVKLVKSKAFGACSEKQMPKDIGTWPSARPLPELTTVVLSLERTRSTMRFTSSCSEV
ncbi:hypothetical protein D3C72_2426680 [compost metagenome]